MRQGNGSCLDEWNNRNRSKHHHPEHQSRWRWHILQYSSPHPSLFSSLCLLLQNFLQKHLVRVTRVQPDMNWFIKQWMILCFYFVFTVIPHWEYGHPPVLVHMLYARVTSRAPANHTKVCGRTGVEDGHTAPQLPVMTRVHVAREWILQMTRGGRSSQLYTTSWDQPPLLVWTLVSQNLHSQLTPTDLSQNCILNTLRLNDTGIFVEDPLVSTITSQTVSQNNTSIFIHHQKLFRI